MTTMTSDPTAPLGDVPPSSQPPVVTLTSSERLWSVLCHLSYFFGLALLAFIFPMVVYLVMRSDSPFVSHHAREALNFHLSLLVYAICCIPLCLLIIGIPLLIAVGVAGLVCSIVAAVKASEGVYYQYPLSIRFFR
jgi:uncharacterized Tic20 family protein